MAASLRRTFILLLCCCAHCFRPGRHLRSNIRAAIDLCKVAHAATVAGSLPERCNSR